MKITKKIRQQISVFAVAIMMLPSATIAQDLSSSSSSTASITTSDQEEITLSVGDIFEILPAIEMKNANYSWILTQDRTFIQAARTQVFRIRLIQPGTYSLLAEIQSEDGSQRLNRTFLITAKAREPGKVDIAGSGDTENNANGDRNSIVTSDPSIDKNGHIILRKNQQLLKIFAVDPDILPISLDTNTAFDSDGDGRPGNDIDDKNTFFQSYATPLYVWFASPVTSIQMQLMTVDELANGYSQKLDISTVEFADQQGFLISPVKIQVTQSMNGTVSFATKYIDGTVPTSPVIYHWNFGDNQESLLMNPTHTYAASGTYTVSLNVRNLVQGKDIANATETVVVGGGTNSGTVVGTGSNGSTGGTTSNSSATSTGDTTKSSFAFGPILLLIGIFIIFVLIGLSVVWLLTKLRGGKSLDQTFEEMEKKVVEKEEGKKPTPIIATPIAATVVKTAPIPSAPKTPEPPKPPSPPAASPKPASPAAPKPPVTNAAPTKVEFAKREENAASSPPIAATPRIVEAAAPSWLKKGLEMGTPAATTQAPSSPQPVPTPPTPAAPKPAPAATPSPAMPKPAAQVPAAPTPPTSPTTPKPAPSIIPSPAPKTSAAPIVPKPTTPSAVPTPAPSVPSTPAAPNIPSPAPTPTPVKPFVPSSTPAAPSIPSAPNPNASVPSWLQTPAIKTENVDQPKTATDSPAALPSIPKPPTPIATPAPISTPAPAVPSIAPTPIKSAPPLALLNEISTPAPASVLPTIAPANIPAPQTPIAPATQTKPVEVQKTREIVPMVKTPAPVTTTNEAPEIMEPETFTQEPTKEANDVLSDEPIAFIRAESLEDKNTDQSI